MTLRLLLDDAEATMELGRLLAQGVAAMPPEAWAEGFAIYLYGDLGSGKTTLVRGLAAALPGGAEAEVSSPSFTLCNMYPTRPVALHADLYRLSPGADLPEEVQDALEEGGLLLLEWPERLGERFLAGDRLDVALEVFPPEPLENLDIAAQPCERKRSASVKAQGKAGCALLVFLRPRLESRFPVLD